MGFVGFLKRFVGAILIGFLLFEITVCELTKEATIPTARTGSFKRLGVTGRDVPVVHSSSDPNYMSKRRVPNGPDPIHNRRAGKSGQPAGRA